ncbi:MAG: CoA-binding protein, partial [bacterium]|nr:CoA-binding protein [bacterium]
VEEIPGPVELRIVTIPAAFVHELIPQFVGKDIRQMLLISSGFGETGEAGSKLEQELAEAAEKAGILVLGPNTMGICNPHFDFFVTGHFVRPKAGGTSVIAQSGNLGAQLLEFAAKEDIGIRAFCGSGNEAMVTIEDYLAAFENDAETRSIMMYVESVRDGRRFLELARRISKKKPLVMLKGGRSAAGKLAAASHTGALSSDSEIFKSACRQAGIVTVKHSMDLLDLAAAFSSLPLPKGNRVAIMTGGGGWGVVTTDLCADYKIEIPELSESIVKQIDALLPAYWSRANPVDFVGDAAFDVPEKVLELLMQWDGCDAVINLAMLGRKNALCQHVQAAAEIDPNCPPDLVEQQRTALKNFEEAFVAHSIRLMEKFRKPVCGVTYIKHEGDKTLYEVTGHEYKGIFLETPERAVKVLARMIEYQQFCACH